LHLHVSPTRLLSDDGDPRAQQDEVKRFAAKERSRSIGSVRKSTKIVSSPSHLLKA
jgi:hypothetical protein